MILSGTPAPRKFLKSTKEDDCKNRRRTMTVKINTFENVSVSIDNIYRARKVITSIYQFVRTV
jgi:hypothetical protein